MKRKFISLMMIGVLAGSMGVSSFADGNSKGNQNEKDAPKYKVMNTSVQNTITSPGGIHITSPGSVVLPDGMDWSDYKVLQNKMEVLKKQIAGLQARYAKAKGNDKKNIENATRVYQKQLEALQQKLKELLNDNRDDSKKYTDKQKEYIKKIEAALKKNFPSVQMVTADKIVTDNPIYKADLPLAVKDGVVYMSQSTIEKSFGVTIKYVEDQKKFVSKVEGVVLEVFLLQNFVELDGMPRKIDAKPITIDGKIYFPLNSIDKLLKIEVKWDKDLKVVTIDDLDIPNPVVVK